MVLAKSGDVKLEQIAGWDTLGFRATCSSGFILSATGDAKQILAEPFADILEKSMHPVSHLTWGSVWLGIARCAVEKARQTVRLSARNNPGVTEINAYRLAELNELLFSMQAGLYDTIAEYETQLGQVGSTGADRFGSSIRINNVKIRCSEMVVEIVMKALQIVGISGYKNDSQNSLSRQLRDACGASLMVNNDRIRGHNATMQIAYKGK